MILKIIIWIYQVKTMEDIIKTARELVKIKSEKIDYIIS
jgi:hypothetical protein